MSTIVGFDIRTCNPATLEMVWGPEERKYFLLRPEIACPISVDTAVTRSIFEFEADATSETGLGPIVIEGEGAHQCALRLWANLRNMKDTAVAAGMPTENVKVIAITALDTEVLLRNDQQWREILNEDVSPNNITSDWKFLGLDVADIDLTSGLSNCTFDLRRDKSFISEWSKRINKHGLIENQKEAEAFAMLLNENVPEHAPFALYGIYEECDGAWLA